MSECKKEAYTGLPSTYDQKGVEVDVIGDEFVNLQDDQ
jgi:hypothetical protein